MRIALVTNNFFPIISGVSVAVANLQHELKKLGHKVFVIAPNYPGCRKDNKSIIRTPSVPIFYRAKYPLPLSSGRYLAKIFKKLNVDIVHTHHPFGLGQSALKACKRYNNIPIVFTNHTLYTEYVHYIPFLIRKISINYIKHTVSNYIDNCDVTIVPNEKLKNDLLCIHPDKTILNIPTGISSYLLEDAKFNHNTNYLSDDIIDSEYNILCVSRITKEKNINFIERISKLLSKQKSKYRIVLAGNGYLKNKLKNNSNLILLGEISHSRMSQLYRNSKLLLFVSKTDTQGLPLIESQPFGLPIIALQSEASEEFVRKINTGIIASDNPESFLLTMLNLLKSQHKLDLISRNNKRLCRDFSAECLVNKVEKVYYQLLN